MHRFNPNTRPAGQITRGKTAPNRLRNVDHFLASYDPALLINNSGSFENAMYVDLGYGAEPTTTLESAARLRKINPDLQVLGVEIEPERVRRGLPFVDDKTQFRLGGFNIPLQKNSQGKMEQIRLVRAFNVLRQYEENEVVPAYDQIMSSILPGGLFMDGTSDPFGRVWTGNMIRRQDEPSQPPWFLEAMVLGTNLNRDLDVEAFQTRLPKSFIHRMLPGENIHRFMEDWKASTRETSSHQVWGPRDWFVAAGNSLADKGYNIARTDKWLRRGWLVWLNPDLEIDQAV